MTSRRVSMLAAGTLLALAAHPAFAAGRLGPVWVGQAAGGQGAGTGTGAGSGTGTGNGVGGGTGTAAGTGPGAAPGSVGGTNAGGTAAGGADSTGATNGSGTNGGGGTNANGNGTNGGGVGASGTGQNAAGTAGAQGSLPLPGASAAPQVFSLAQTVQAALQSSADIQTAARNVEIDARRADEAAAAARPNLSASGQATRFDQKTTVALGGGPPVQVTGTHVEILQLNLTDRLDLTGQIAASAGQARLQSLADTFILSRIRNARILRAQTIYFNTLRAQHQVDVAQAALTNARRQLADATNLNNAGVGQRIDVYRAQTQVSNAEQDVAAAENNYGVALNNFNDLVGRPLNAPVRLQDAPGVTLTLPVTDFSQVGAPDPKAAPPLPNAPAEVAAIDINAALAQAGAQRPEILQGQVAVRVAQTGVTLARAGLEPTFSLAAAGNYYPDTNFQFPRRRTAQITANLNIPLYDGGATRDRIQEARLSTQNAQTSLASTRSDVALDVRQSFLNLATASRQIGAANAALQSAIAARQLAQLRYQGQVGLYLEVTDAQAALVQAENNQVDAVYNYLVARAQFQNAVGTPQIR